MNGGWIKLYRKLMESVVWNCTNSKQKTIFLTILLLASHKENGWWWKGEEYKVQPGQFVTSLESLREKSGSDITIQNVKTALKLFKKLEILTEETTKTGRLITVVKWEKYQHGDDEPNKEDNKDLTKSQQRPNKDLTPIKNVRMKECKNEIIKDIKNSSSEIENFRQRYNESDLSTIDEYFDILRWTRKNGKIADSVLAKIYKEWEKFSVPKVIHSLNVYIDNPKYHDRKENYCYGIMRNVKSEEVRYSEQPKANEETRASVSFTTDW